MHRPPSPERLTAPRRRLLPLALLLLGGGCAPPGAPAVQGGSRAIIGGVTDPQDPAIVLLVGTARRALSLCTAEVISPHVVLTAAHCVDPSVVGKGVTYQVFTGADFNDPAQYNDGGNYLGVASTQFDPLFDVSNLQGGHDVGLVVTSKAIDIAPLPLNRAPLVNADNGTAFRLVGYGVNNGTDTRGASAGTKRQTTSVLYAYDDMFLEFNDPKHLTCEGDSGGPALLNRNGVELIAGITSFGDQGCTQVGVDTRVDSYLELIDGVVAAAEGSGPAPDLGVVAAPDLAVAGDGGTGPVGGGGGGGEPTFDGGLARAGNGSAAVGDPCAAHSDCHSGLCAFTGVDSGYCTAPCNPAVGGCPAGYACGRIEGASYCVWSPSSPSGCSVGAGSSTAPALLPLAVALAMLLASRRRRVARAPR